MNQLKFWIAVGLGSGLSPKAPGTAGTLGSLPLIVLVWDASFALWALGFIVLCALSIWSIPEAGRRLGKPDHGQIDIAKPWAVSWCERKIPGAWGVLMDDVAAGGYVLILALVFGMLSGHSG
jgi:phosphatidylglycerophosphatase A